MCEHRQEKSKAAKSNGNGVDVNGFLTKRVDQYEKNYAVGDVELPGLPEIVYDSRIVHSHEPTIVPAGVEITVCKGVPHSL